MNNYNGGDESGENNKELRFLYIVKMEGKRPRGRPRLNGLTILIK